ncbi:unnamed protein product [Rotaria sp. Silwood1]|nr:unnamed protein product [Rotaria sp. Silwood1]CAF4767646.1 unnamed protein product [Rotaria sp. Silwood1]
MDQNIKEISLPSTPFVENYFYYPNGEFKHPDDINQLVEYDYNYQLYLMAHYGSIGTICNMFIYGEILFQWSDLVKLRFGSRREDCPSLYRYMKEYTRLIAKTFHGSRLDHYHSTPLWFAELNFLLEIFKQSWRANNAYELAQYVSLVSEDDPIDSFKKKNNYRQLLSNKPYLWFYDNTHDNPCQIERRSIEDTITRSVCVSMAYCSTGSNRGYDELIPHYIDVVHETRFYSR